MSNAGMGGVVGALLALAGVLTLIGVTLAKPAREA